MLKLEAQIFGRSVSNEWLGKVTNIMEIAETVF